MKVKSYFHQKMRKQEVTFINPCRQQAFGLTVRHKIFSAALHFRALACLLNIVCADNELLDVLHF